MVQPLLIPACVLFSIQQRQTHFWFSCQWRLKIAHREPKAKDKWLCVNQMFSFEMERDPVFSSAHVLFRLSCLQRLCRPDHQTVFSPLGFNYYFFGRVFSSCSFALLNLLSSLLFSSLIDIEFRVGRSQRRHQEDPERRAARRERESRPRQIQNSAADPTGQHEAAHRRVRVYVRTAPQG